MSKEKEFELDELADEFEMTPEEMQEVLDAVDEFQEDFLCYLAGSDKYELISTVDKYGNPLTEKQFNLVKRESSRLGVTCLFMIQQGANTLIVNPKTLKMSIVNDELH